MAIATGFTVEDLRDRAGESSFARARDYLDAVTGLEVTADGVTATVYGTDCYEVTLTMDAGKGLAGSCDCPYGLDGNFCKHCVAVGLVVLDQGVDLPRAQAAAADRGRLLESWLEALPRDRLLALLRERLAEDESLRRRLEVRAAAERAATGTDIAGLRAQILKLLSTAPFARYDYVEYADVPGYAAQAREAVDALRSLVTAGRASEAVTLTREAIGRLHTVSEQIDDSSGAVGEVAADLEETHRAACLDSGTDPVKNAEWLAAHMLGDWSHLPEIDLGDYWDLLGDTGRAAFADLVAEKSRHRPADWNVRHVGQELARVQGDVDALVAVLASDLAPYGGTHLAIAEELDRAGRSTEALEWAERGLRDTVRPPFADDGLADYVAGRYERDGRLADAVAVRRDRFRASPSLHGYQHLRDTARRARSWDAERAAALDLLREEPPARKPFGGGPLLIDALIDDGDVEAAWRAAEGRASDRQWLVLAGLVRGDRPADALEAYRRAMEPLTRLTGDGNYREIARLLLLARDCHRRLGTEHAFAMYLTALRTDQRRKRKLMKILDQEGL